MILILMPDNCDLNLTTRGDCNVNLEVWKTFYTTKNGDALLVWIRN